MNSQGQEEYAPLVKWAARVFVLLFVVCLFLLPWWSAPAMMLYLYIGFRIARRACPYSFPTGNNAVLVAMLWPWPIAAHCIFKVTGRYPRWTPPL